MSTHNNHQAMNSPTGDTPEVWNATRTTRLRGSGPRWAPRIAADPPSPFLPWVLRGEHSPLEFCHHCLQWLTRFPRRCFINTPCNDGVSLGAGHSRWRLVTTQERHRHSPNPPWAPPHIRGSWAAHRTAALSEIAHGIAALCRKTPEPGIF